jgi:hypothetical protein
MSLERYGLDGFVGSLTVLLDATDEGGQIVLGDNGFHHQNEIKHDAQYEHKWILNASELHELLLGFLRIYLFFNVITNQSDKGYGVCD